MISYTALGLISGLFAAFMQSSSYLGGRRFLSCHGNANQLLTASMVICGIAACLLLPFVGHWEKLLSWKMFGYLLICNGGFLAGQWGFFCAQKHIESSRIASLLGLKIIVVVFLSLTVLGERFTLLQYIAVAVAALAGMLMNWSSGKLNWNGMGYLLVALIGYAVSDTVIQLVVTEVHAENPIVGGLCGYAFNYLLSGLLGLLALRHFKVNMKMLAGAVPQAVCWTLSMWGLYVCFGLVGAAFGNVIQASRGVISLLLGIVLSYFAINGLEQKQSTAVWMRKAAAAILMFGAIVVYALTAKG